MCVCVFDKRECVKCPSGCISVPSDCLSPHAAFYKPINRSQCWDRWWDASRPPQCCSTENRESSKSPLVCDGTDGGRGGRHMSPGLDFLHTLGGKLWFVRAGFVMRLRLYRYNCALRQTETMFITHVRGIHLEILRELSRQGGLSFIMIWGRPKDGWIDSLCYIFNVLCIVCDHDSRSTCSSLNIT